MNLMGITTKDWSHEVVNVIAGDGKAAKELLNKLGAIVPSHSVVGKVANYFCKRFLFFFVLWKTTRSLILP